MAYLASRSTTSGLTLFFPMMANSFSCCNTLKIPTINIEHQLHITAAQCDEDVDGDDDDDDDDDDDGDLIIATALVVPVDLPWPLAHLEDTCLKLAFCLYHLGHLWREGKGWRR